MSHSVSETEFLFLGDRLFQKGLPEWTNAMNQDNSYCYY